MTLQFEHKQDHEIFYNFCIHYNPSKHHLHHENNFTSKTANAAQLQWYRKLIGTSEKHNWSSRPPTNMNHNFLKSLGSYLQLSYSHIKMILQLEGSINPIITALSKT